MTSRIPCFLCGKTIPIKSDKKKGKPYFICNDCGVQTFIRRGEGISRLENLIQEIEGNLSNSIKIQALTSELLNLERQLSQVKAEQGIDAFFDENNPLKIAEVKISEEIQRLKTQIQNLNQEEK